MNVHTFYPAINHTIMTAIIHVQSTLKRTFLSLLHLEREIQRPDGEVHGLGIALPHRAEQIEYLSPLSPNQAGQQLGYPWQPVYGGDPHVVLIDGFGECSLVVVVGEHPDYPGEKLATL